MNVPHSEQPPCKRIVRRPGKNTWIPFGAFLDVWPRMRKYLAPIGQLIIVNIRAEPTLRGTYSYHRQEGNVFRFIMGRVV